ncbi:MAG: hypothetical protein F4X69_15775 [Gemmatimonadetes bacterium]|nr:hypothetical protein [Gemmatimonadota bacterium]
MSPETVARHACDCLTQLQMSLPAVTGDEIEKETVEFYKDGISRSIKDLKYYNESLEETGEHERVRDAIERALQILPDIDVEDEDVDLAIDEAKEDVCVLARFFNSVDASRGSSGN